jgi:hypothetical protein
MTDAWGPRLPVDPPPELDGDPLAQKVWIRLVGPNNELRDLDTDIVLIFCQMFPMLVQLESMRSHLEPNSDQESSLIDREIVQLSLMRKYFRSFYSDDAWEKIGGKEPFERFLKDIFPDGVPGED